MFNNVPLRIRRVLLNHHRLCTGIASLILILNRTSLNCINALLALNWQYGDLASSSAYKNHLYENSPNTLLKSDVTRDHVVRCRGSQECGSRNVNFACKFHRRSHRVRITLKSTTFLFMRSKNVWTTKPWQRS